MVLAGEPPAKIFAVGFLLLSFWRIDKRDLLHSADFRQHGKNGARGDEIERFTPSVNYVVHTGPVSILERAPVPVTVNRYGQPGTRIFGSNFCLVW